MPCPLCQKIYCSHTPAQRGQTIQEIVEIYRQDAGKYLPAKPPPTVESAEEPPDAEGLEPQEAEA